MNTSKTSSTRRRLKAGDLVEVRSKEEILATLDANGELDAMPFMPEMLQYCGKRFRVSKSAHKTCDPVNGLDGRRLPETVHLEDLRCNGAEHDGCQAGCLLYWKYDWLRPVSSPFAASAATTSAGSCTEQALRDVIRTETNDEVIYRCQATRVAAATTTIPAWDWRQYAEDLATGNASIAQMAAAAVYTFFHTLASLGIGCGSAVRWMYDKVQKIRGGVPYPARIGKVPPGVRTPQQTLDIQVGEIVRIKPYSEILETLDEQSRNRGLYFDSEMVPHCGTTRRVLDRVERIIHEGTGKMLHFKNPALILEGVVCEARYAKHRRFCPRAYYQYCREAWVERLPEGCGPEVKQC